MKFYKLLIFSLLFSFTLSLSIYAADSAGPDKVRVGLYYTTTAVNSVSLTSDAGFEIGYNKANAFNKIYNETATAIVAKKDITNNNLPAYHIQIGNTYPTYLSALNVAQAFQKKGYNVFVAYDDTYKVLADAFASANDANAEINLLKKDFGSYTYSVVNPIDKAIQLVANNNINFVFSSGTSALQLNPISNTQDKIIGVNDKKYRGIIRIIRQTGSDMTVINDVETNYYLYSVVSSEMYPSWKIEALKAQAVAARTYLINTLNSDVRVKNTYGPLGFDLNGTTEFQSYQGYRKDKEIDSVKKAVDDTKNLELYYNNKLISALYFSSDGGYTENSENYWVNAVPYLKAVEDKYQPKDFSGRNWEVTMTPDDIKSALKASNIDIGDITDVQVTTYTKSGNAIALKIIGTKGEKTFEKSAIRAFVSSKILPSLTFKVTKQGGDSVSVINSTLKTSSRSLNNSKVITKNGATYIQIGSGLLIKIGNGTKTITSSPATFVFDGAGHGHEVGMSQWGAEGMAEAGFTFDQILKYYYTGVDIK